MSPPSAAAPSEAPSKAPSATPAAAASSATALSAGSPEPGYQPLVPNGAQFLTIRSLRYHLRTWQTPSGSGRSGPLLVLLHGWMDVSASFQFVVDALQGQWQVVAPDWRGFGLSEGSPGREHAVDGYAFVDYLGDLDAILDQLSPTEPVRIVAHSMGGNVAMLYAGVRPQRVAGVVNLEGFGLPGSDPAKAVLRYRRWLDELKTPFSLRSFDSLEDVAARLMKTNPRLTRDKALYLARHWARPIQGKQVLRADPAHKRINPIPYRVDEVLSCWGAIECPVLWVESQDRDSHHQFTTTADYRRRLAGIRRLQEVQVADAGHMLHHDQPGRIAGLIEDFFRR
jgi:pimeloyl-ACP methyl ester carboxylesterase